MTENHHGGKKLAVVASNGFRLQLWSSLAKLRDSAQAQSLCGERKDVEMQLDLSDS